MNVLTVTGRLTADPTRRDATAGMVCEFRIAVDGRRGMWLPVVCWGPLAGSCYRRLHAGDRVALSGPLELEEQLSGAGARRRRWYLKAEHATFLLPDNATSCADHGRQECQ
jgi:single-stranded DNA-binding protein